MRILSPLPVLLLLAACSPAGESTPRTDVAGVSEGVTYLRGVESEYSMPLEKLSSREVLAPDTAMRDALIAGDGEYYVAAALFRHAEYLTLDLIVLNHSESSLKIDRSDLRIVDSKGNWLSPVDDYEDAYLYGLRGKQDDASALAFYDAPTNALSQESMMSPDVIGGTGSTQWKSGPSGQSAPNRRPVGSDAEWHGAADQLHLAPNAPSAVTVKSQEGRAFWGYWQAEALEFPLTAFVMLEDRHLIFEFDR
jgi:hypothetical protein